MLSQTLAATLWIHISAGVGAIIAGLVAIVTTKGAPRHLRAGRIYAIAMGIVVVTAVPLALVDGNYFLLTVAVFSGYLVVAGYRVLSRKRPTPGVAAPLDWAAHLTMVGFGLGMVGLGGYDLWMGDGLGVVPLVFGAIGLSLAGREIQAIFSPPDERMAWFYRHIGFMGGAYIATVTAAATVNLTMLPSVARWLGPTLVGTPAILWGIARYRGQFDDAAEKTAA